MNVNPDTLAAVVNQERRGNLLNIEFCSINISINTELKQLNLAV